MPPTCMSNSSMSLAFPFQFTATEITPARPTPAVQIFFSLWKTVNAFT